MMDGFVLDEHGNPMPFESTEEWAEWFEKSDKRRVAYTDLGALPTS